MHASQLSTCLVTQKFMCCAYNVDDWPGGLLTFIDVIIYERYLLISSVKG
jgi:hypothetical protein